MRILFTLLAIATLAPIPALAVSQASIDQAVFSQEFCNRFTENAWIQEYVDPEFGTDSQEWTFLRDGTFQYALHSDYIHNASGKWFLKKATDANVAEVYLLITNDDSAFGGLYSTSYVMAFTEGKLHMKSDGRETSYNLSPSTVNEGQPSECPSAQTNSRRMFRVFEKLADSTWNNDDVTMYVKGELEFNDAKRGMLQKGNLDIIPEKNLLVLKGAWKQYPLGTRTVDLRFHYFFRGNRLILKFAQKQEPQRFVLPYTYGDIIILEAK